MKKFKKITCLALALVLSLALLPTTGANAASVPKPVEYAIFPARTLNVSQVAYEGYSHGSQNAIDILPGGDVVAPFDGTIVYTDPNWGYVMLQSREKVLWADGTYDYMSVGFMHDENISNLWVGKKIDQGVAFYQAGGMGNGNPNAYGDHVHITCHRGKVTRGYPYGNGNVYAYDALFIDKSFTTKTTGYGEGYKGQWDKLDSYFAKCTYYHLDPMRVKVTEPTCFKTLPCSKGTTSASKDIRNGRIGESVYVLGLYKNSANNYWFKVVVDNRIGYLYAGNTDHAAFPALYLQGMKHY